MGWPDFLIIYTEKCKRQTIWFLFYFGNKNGGNNSNPPIWVISYRSSYCGIPSFFLRDFGPLNKHTPNPNSIKTNKCATRERKKIKIWCVNILEWKVRRCAFHFCPWTGYTDCPWPKYYESKTKQHNTIYCVPSTALGFTRYLHSLLSPPVYFISPTDDWDFAAWWLRAWILTQCLLVCFPCYKMLIIIVSMSV